MIGVHKDPHEAFKNSSQVEQIKFTYKDEYCITFFNI